MSESLLWRAQDGAPPADVTPERAGWDLVSFAVRLLAPGEDLEGETGPEEACFVVLGGRVRVEADGRGYDLGERATPWDGMPWALYLPIGTAWRLHGATDAEVAICASRAERSFPARVVTPDDVRVEVRGAGNATRQINHIMEPGFPADRLLVVEVFTPPGNWSSYPPHRHETVRLPEENALEEIYYYRVDRPEGFGVQRLYTDDGAIDETWTVRDRDLMLVPRGYHPFAAGHGYGCYYLNVLAGPGSERSMAAADDPQLAWTRAAWEGQPTDPRCPWWGAVTCASPALPCRSACSS